MSVRDVQRVLVSCRKILSLSHKTHLQDSSRLMQNARFCTSRKVNTIFQSREMNVPIPEQSLTEYLFPKFDQFGPKTAMVEFTTGRSYTYSQTKDAVVKVASALTKLGYKKGDIIAIYATNSPEYTILLLACAAAGIIPTTANPAYTPPELARHLTHSGASAIFAVDLLIPNVKAAISSDPNLENAIKEVVAIGNADGYKPFSVFLEDDGQAFPENVDINPTEDIAVLPYSSGTTGLPKGVMLTHMNLVSNLQQFRLYINVTPEDTSLGVLPLYHIYGMVPVMKGVLQDGGAVVTLPRFDPEMFLKACMQHKVTQLHVVPPIVVFMAKHPAVAQFDLSSLNRIICGAAPLGESLSVQLMDRLNAPITQGYGLTETSPVVNVDGVPPKNGTVGYLVSNTEAKVVCPETDKALSQGECGELCYRGPQVMKGYLNNEKATKDMIRDGWLHSGDIGMVQEDGRFVVTDRLKELIKYKGYQVPPAELEDLLLRHPSVQDAAVIGVPDEEAGELPRAYVVPKPDTKVTAEDIEQYVKDNVAPQKKLRGGVQFIEQIPKSPAGKILRRILRDGAN